MRFINLFIGEKPLDVAYGNVCFVLGHLYKWLEAEYLKPEADRDQALIIHLRESIANVNTEWERFKGLPKRQLSKNLSKFQQTLLSV